MNQYFLPKSGWEFFDVSRAYGLGIIVHALSGEAVVSDAGGFYLIETKRNIDFNRFEHIYQYFGNEQDWNWTFLTIGAKQRNKIKEKVVIFMKESQNVENMLNNFEVLKSSMCFDSGKETLYQSMELAATKGIRDEVLLKKQYSEGAPIKIPVADFTLSVIGHINVTVRKFSKANSIFAVAAPLNTKISHLREIKSRIDTAIRNLHRAGWFSSLAHLSINLVLEEMRVKEGGKFTPTFGSLLYGVMIKTGTQWKPFTGGIFPLDFLHQIAESEEAVEILNRWRDIFERTAFKKGYEDISIALAEFIANPNLSNYERYIKLHLRNDLDKQRIKFGSYEEKTLEEVIKHVGV